MPQGSLASKPTNLTFEQASAVGVSALTALQALRDQGDVQPGQKVLVTAVVSSASTGLSSTDCARLWQRSGASASASQVPRPAPRLRQPLIRHDESVKIVQARLGHASAAELGHECPPLAQERRPGP